MFRTARAGTGIVRLATVVLTTLLLPAGLHADPPPMQTLNFTLQDTLGRELRSSDYAGQVVLVTCGAAWCGGCQQDACVLPAVIERYAPQGLQVIHAVSGDGDLDSFEFQRHYRLNIVHLLDVNRQFEKQYNRDGWPFTMLFGADGRLLYQSNDALDQVGDALAPKIEQAMKQAEDNRLQPIVRDGVGYMPATLQRSGEQERARLHERFASLAAGRDGRLYLAFTSNRRRNSDVYLRVYDGEKWLKDIAIAEAAADAFDATVLVDKAGKVWLAWTALSADGRYNIFVATVDAAGKVNPPEQVAQAADDAMHARLGCDAQGRVWLTYYRWQRNASGLSRDREVYVRRHDGKAWSREIQVSPTDVPGYEDHCQPTLLPAGEGMAVAWTWDFHKPDGYPAHLQDPTVFVRTIGADLSLGSIVPLGDAQVDECPAVAGLGEGQAWCAWAESVWQTPLRANRKLLLARSFDPEGGKQSGAVRIGGARVSICTPCLVAREGGALTLLWSEQAAPSGPWQLKRSDLKGAAWSAPSTVYAQDNPRTPSAAYDSHGNLWIAYTRQAHAGREIACTPLPKL